MGTREKREEYINKYGEPKLDSNLKCRFARDRNELEAMLDMSNCYDTIDFVERNVEEYGYYIGLSGNFVVFKTRNDLYGVVANEDLMELMWYSWN